MAFDIAELHAHLADWRARVKHRISQRVPPGLRNDAEVERRFRAILDTEVPTDADLVAMQQRGELPSDEELARGGK